MLKASARNVFRLLKIALVGQSLPGSGILLLRFCFLGAGLKTKLETSKK